MYIFDNYGPIIFSACIITTDRGFKLSSLASTKNLGSCSSASKCIIKIEKWV